MRGVAKGIATRSTITHTQSRLFSTAPNAAEKLELEKQQSASLEKEKKMFTDYLLKKPSLEERRQQNSELYPSTLATYAAIQANRGDDFDGSYLHFDDKHIAPYVRKSISKELEACGNYFMLRPHSAEIINRMMYTVPGAINSPKKPFGVQANTFEMKHDNMFLLSGHRGTGKTQVLATAVAYAHQNNWAVLATSLEMFTNDKMGYIVESKTESGVFEQRLTTRQFFQDNWAYMKDAFSKIQLQGDYSEVNWESSPNDDFNPPSNPEILTRYNRMPFPDPNVIPRPSGVPQTGADLIALGAWRADLAHFVMKALIFEMQHTKDVPCLIAVDNINALDQLTNFQHPVRFTKLTGKRLSVPNALLNSLTITPAYGMTIIAVSSKSTMKNVDDYVYRAGRNIVVGGYNMKEMQCALEHYSASRFTHVPLDVSLLRGVEALTGRVPEDLRKWCSFN